jgi:hypothetical protein
MQWIQQRQVVSRSSESHFLLILSRESKTLLAWNRRTNMPKMIALFTIFAAFGMAPGSAQADLFDTPSSTTKSDYAESGHSDSMSPYKKTGIGCAAGAVLGSVAPGLGNVVGCVVGGLVAWWRA